MRAIAKPSAALLINSRGPCNCFFWFMCNPHCLTLQTQISFGMSTISQPGLNLFHNANYPFTFCTEAFKIKCGIWRSLYNCLLYLTDWNRWKCWKDPTQADQPHLLVQKVSAEVEIGSDRVWDGFGPVRPKLSGSIQIEYLVLRKLRPFYEQRFKRLAPSTRFCLLHVWPRRYRWHNELNRNKVSNWTFGPISSFHRAHIRQSGSDRVRP